MISHGVSRSTVLAASVGVLTQLWINYSPAAEVPSGDIPATQASTRFSGAMESSDSLVEIIVTANKRNESVQKAPAAITALSGDALQEQRIQTAVDLTKVVPSATIVSAPAVSQAFIRGVGNNIDNPYVDPGVAINVNGISTPRYATSAGFLDVARVEVLPGPQGTLYGGSAAGGVVNVITVQPSHDFDGEGILEAGNYGMAHAFVAQYLAVGTDPSLRTALDFERHDGYESRNIDSERAKISGRLSALWTPSESFTAYVFGSFFDNRGKPQATVNAPLLNSHNPWSLPLTGPLLGNPVDADYGKISAGYMIDIPAHRKERRRATCCATDDASGFRA